MATEARFIRVMINIKTATARLSLVGLSNNTNKPNKMISVMDVMDSPSDIQYCRFLAQPLKISVNISVKSETINETPKPMGIYLKN